MLRCPTCVAILPDPTARRCPSCGQNLRRRGRQPVQLGDRNRLTTRMSAIEHRLVESRAHSTRTTGRASSPAREILAFTDDPQALAPPEPLRDEPAPAVEIDLTAEVAGHLDLTAAPDDEILPHDH